MDESSARWFVGCACDRAFVQHTSVMLTSLAENGGVPEATIIVAAFDLAPEDYEAIRAHAGTLRNHVHFVDVTAAMLEDLAGRDWEAHYPLAVLGRLFVASAIDTPEARLLTLDSDMIVNTSVRPLFELDLLGDYVGAIHDTPRTDDLNYFNSGMMVIDVDKYSHYAVAARALRWLADRTERPQWPDQDALNTVVGHRWYRLDRRWNWAFCGAPYDEQPLTAAHYENAFIAHFTGQGKPWSSVTHPGRSLYMRHLRDYEARARRYRAAMDHIDANFTATAIEVLLGREPRNLAELRSLTGTTAVETVAAIAQSIEFASNAVLSVKLDRPLPVELFQAPLTLRHRLWVAERLALHDDSAKAARTASSWHALLSTIVLDSGFARMARLQPMIAFADRARAQLLLSS